ncbi:MAG: asparagine synthase (glutamine-hydrolyzing) [Methylobacter tundripaludum]|nr:asparagine synthase (glutamine-hydrolyzing) [Methylobacter tundripaludum]
MCGICGKLNFNRQNPVGQGLIRQMMDMIQHRGPDGSGEFLSGPVGLGHRRLSIIDLDTGGQPMSNEDGTVWVVYNGEIYNFHELRTELEEKGHHFKSTTDTEVIVHLYEELGDQCVARLRGMFAFALWDERKQRLLLARDRVGVKPLYYTNTGKSLIFASEIKSLLVDPDVERRVNPHAIDRFLTYYYLPGNESLFDGIFKLDPGHYLTVQDGRTSVEQYWDLRFEIPPSPPSFDEAVDVLRELLSRTVKDHMISDVPVGVLLSGGVDSTGILSYATQHADRPMHTFTMGFSGANFQDERPYAKLASQKFGTIHHEISMSANDFREFLPKYVWHMEEPVCEPPAIALYFVSQLARQSSVKVLLSGEGGDEAFGGYQTYRNLLILEKLKSACGPAKGLLRLGFQALEHAGYKRIGQYANLVEPTLAEYYLSRTATPYTPFNQRKPELYNKEFAAFIDMQSSGMFTRKLFEQVSDQPLLSRMLYVDTKTWLPDDLLVKADKMTMAASVELRVPLLDYRVLEFAASLPLHYKVNGWKLKRILKAALVETVPQEILNRKKTGFPVPYDDWMRKEMKDFVFDTILATNAGLDSYFCKDALTNLLQSHQKGKGYSKEVFSLLVLALWHQQFAGLSPAV